MNILQDIKDYKLTISISIGGFVLLVIVELLRGNT